MRCSFSRLTPVVLLAAVLAVDSIGAGQARAQGAWTQKDSVVIEVPVPPTPPTPPGRKRIVIGGSGVRVIDEEASDSAFGFDFEVTTDEHEHGDNVVKVGESVYVAPGEVIAGDIVVFGGNAVIEGTVTGSVVVLGGEIRARNGSEIRGDIVAIGGKIAEDEDVVIRGEKIVVGGITTRVGDTLDIGGRTLRTIASALLLFVGLVLLLITVLFLRERVERTGDVMCVGLLRSFGAGILTSIAIDFALAIITIPLIITVVGIPLAIILVLSYFGAFVISCAVFVHAVGRAIAVRAGIGAGVFGRMLLGFVVLSVPEFAAFIADGVAHAPMSFYVFLKIVSCAVWLIAYVVGLGAIVTSRFGTRPPVGTEPPPARVTEYAPTPAS